MFQSSKVCCLQNVKKKITLFWVSLPAGEDFFFWWRGGGGGGRGEWEWKNGLFLTAIVVAFA